MNQKPSLHKLKSIATELNRLRTQQVVLERKVAQQSKSERRARTRTLIQMGSLINMRGLADLCGITEGDDLQLDMESRDKAAILLGMLGTLVEQLPPALSSSEIEAFKQKGIRIFKQHETKKYRDLV